MADARGIDTDPYSPSSKPVSDWVHELLTGQLSDWSLIDFGARRGRALLVAAQQGYRRIISVKLDKELCDEVEANIAGLPPDPTAADRAQIVRAKAARHRLPDGANVIYFAAPFGRRSTEAFVESLCEQYEEARRPIVIIYYSSMFEDVFDGCPCLHRLRLPAILSPHAIPIYATPEALPRLRLKPTIATGSD